jgi:hypothetical protein
MRARWLRLIIALCLFGAIPMIGACEDEGPVEETVEETGDEIEETTD